MGAPGSPLELFRQGFCLLVANGHYSLQHEQRARAMCAAAGLDWNQAQTYIRDDALRVLERMVARIIADTRVTAVEVAEVRAVQQRLCIPDDQAGHLVEGFFDLIERRLAQHINTYAAAVGEVAAMQALHAEIVRYRLSPLRTTRLLQELETQHRRLALGVRDLPLVQTEMILARDEVCHYDAPVLVSAHDGLTTARLVITNRRLVVHTRSDDLTAVWAQYRAVETMYRALVLVTTTYHVLLLCAEPHDVAQLLMLAQRRYGAALLDVA